MALLAFLSAGLGGYGYYSSLKELQIKEAERRTIAHAAGVKNHIDSYIAENLKAARAISRVGEFREALILPDFEQLAEANRVLDLFCDALEAGVCYLLNREGVTLASSNRAEIDSFVGKDYSFRPYFQEAIAGNPAVYMAVGVTSGIRGIYYSQPVWGKGSAAPIGVLVVKAPVNTLEAGIYPDDEGNWVLADPHGMIFASNRPEWRYRLLWETTPVQVENIGRLRQFGVGPWEWIGLRPDGQTRALDSVNNRYLIHRVNLDHYPHWYVAYLVNRDSILKGVADPLIRKGSYVALVLCILIGWAVVFLYRTASQDLVRRKAAEQAVKESEQRYRIVFENTGTGTVLSEDDRTISMANAEFERITGYSREEIEGRMKWTEFVAPEDHARMKDYHIRRREGDPDTPTRFECSIIDRHGTVKNMFLKVGLISGTRTSVGSFLDITEYKRAVRALEKSEARYRQFFEGDFSGAYISRPDGTLVDCNPAFARIFGFSSPEEALKTDLNTVYPDSTVRSDFLKKLKRDRKVTYYESRMRRRDGSVVHTLENAIGIFDADGELTEIWGYLMDVTEQRDLENQLRQALKMEAVGTLAGGVAHDFNNLMMAVQGNISMMLHGLDSTHPHYPRLKSIEGFVQSGSKLTAQLLGYARKGRFELKSLDLNKLVRNTAETVARTRKDISLITDLSDDLSSIEADRSQIEQILLNLYINAFDAMPAGGRLYLKTRNVDHREVKGVQGDAKDATHYVLLEVTDNGIGMEQEILERIFDPFFTTKEMGRGTGLGLASAFGIIHNHGGHIHVTSLPGGGSSFSVFFPASSQPEIRPKEVPGEMMTGTGAILLVDDERMIGEIGAQMLEALGFEVQVACGGKEAIALYEADPNRFRMVVLDLIMPEMSGEEVLERLQTINPGVKVLLSSGYSLEAKAQHMLERGCRGFIQKPFSLEALSGKIEEVLKMKPSEGTAGFFGAFDTDSGAVRVQ